MLKCQGPKAFAGYLVIKVLKAVFPVDVISANGQVGGYGGSRSACNSTPSMKHRRDGLLTSGLVRLGSI